MSGHVDDDVYVFTHTFQFRRSSGQLSDISAPSLVAALTLTPFS